MKIFKPLNLIILFSFFFLVYIGYINFNQPNKNNSKNSKIHNINKVENEGDDKSGGDINNNKKEEILKPETKYSEDMERLQDSIIDNNPGRGFYRNTAYNYSISYPAEWPLRVKSKKNISVGYENPVNGVGVLSVKIINSYKEKVEKIKEEVKKNPDSVVLKKEGIFIDNFRGDKYVLTDKINGERNYFVLIRREDFVYSIEYSDESERFLNIVEDILNNFSFFVD